MALVRISSLPDPGAADLGNFPNALGWNVFGPQKKMVGQVVDIYLHDDTGEIVALAIRPTSGDQTYSVPVEEIVVDARDRSIRVHRNLGEFEATLVRAHDQPFLLRTLLQDYGVAEEAIDVLEAAGILSMEQLRALVQRGGLMPLLGPERRSRAREIERVIREQKF